MDDGEEENEVVRGLDGDFRDCEIVEGGDRDCDEDEDSDDERFSECEMVEGGDSDGDEDSDYFDDEIDDDGSGTEESLDDCVEEKVAVREKKRKRTGGGEGGRKNTPSIERTDEKKRIGK